LQLSTERLTGALADRYRIERELGSGGMATVFLAHDLRHDRRVALKVLRPELASEVGADRFLREIRLAAGLMHPHILPLFDSGEAAGFLYYVMPVVEGDSLRDRLNEERQLPVDEAVRIIREVADALDYAHRRDVVHRDIKPENILLHDGHALVADFGIGKALSAGTEGATMTQVGMALGTPAYMSPEQAAGEHAVDGRSDLYSLGCVFYELLTGEPLYTGPTAAAVIARRFSMPPPDVTKTRDGVPTPVGQAIARLLARDPADRFGTGGQLVDLLRKVQSPAAGVAPEVQSLAVLPFANMSADAENEYFSDGITEEIINALVQLPDLRVAARTSVFAFKGKNQDLRVVAEKLNVRTVLEGSVRKAGDRLRITAQLINASDGYHLWSERFDRKLDDVFEVQDEIARTIAEKLKVRLTGGGQAPLVKPSTESTEAYQLYLQGRHYWSQRGLGLLKAAKCFQQALEKDPDFALAHAGIADTLGLLGFYGFSRQHDVMPRARAAAERALAIDPNLAEAHTALGFVWLSYDYDIGAAKRSFERAIALKPTYVTARYWYASALIASNDVQQAIAMDEEAVRIEPLSLFANAHLGWMFLCAGQFEDAVSRLEQTLELDPNFLMARWLLGQTYIHLGRVVEGIRELERANEISGGASWMLATLGAVYGHLGRNDEARTILHELLKRTETQYVRAFLIAQVYSRMVDNENALIWAERALEERDAALPYSEARVTRLLGMALAESTMETPEYANLERRLGIKQ
jgi:serine/threonine protein kinase/tetratricopeptide (TPR) repeat protein